MQVFKIKRKVLFTIKILFYQTLHLFPSWDDSKRARGGPLSYFVNSKIYNISTPFAPTEYPIIAPPYSCLLIAGDWFFLWLLHQWHRLTKITKTEVVGLQKLKWLIFDCCRKTNHLRYIWTVPLYRPRHECIVLYGQKLDWVSFGKTLFNLGRVGVFVCLGA